MLSKPVLYAGRLLGRSFCSKCGTFSLDSQHATRYAQTEIIIAKHSPIFSSIRWMSSGGNRTLYFAKSHEYIDVDQSTKVGTVGISQHAIDALGDLVYIELPEVGKEVSAGDDVAVVESVKAASDIYSPAAGKVTAVNDPVANEPALVSKNCMGDGWLFKLELADVGELDGLMKQKDYDEFLKGLEDESH